MIGKRHVIAESPGTRRWLIAVLAAVCWPVAAAGQPAGDPAAMVPADAGVFIRIDHLADLRRDAANQPIAALIESQLPHRRHPEAWESLQQLLGLSEEEIIERYFGRTIVMIAEDDEGGPGLLLSRVERADADRVIERLGLEKVETIGAFALYRSQESGRVAFSDEWMALGDGRHATFVRQVLGGMKPGESLAESPLYRELFAALPAESVARLFVHKPATDETHAAVALLDERRLEMHYIGRSGEIAEVLTLLGDAPILDARALLSPDALAAVAINLIDVNPGPEETALMDRLVSPKKYASDILPKLGSPTVLFLDELPAEALSRAPAHPVPVVGMAIRLRDIAVAEDLANALANLAAFVNILTLEWRTPPIAMRTVHGEHGAYYVVEMGPPLAARLNAQELEPLARITYGRIGPWFVLCSHDEWFVRAAKRFVSSDPGGIVSTGRLTGGTPVIRSRTRVAAIADHVDRWIAYLEAARPKMMASLEQSERSRPIAEALRRHEEIRTLLLSVESVEIEAAALDASTLRALLTVTAAPVVGGGLPATDSTVAPAP